MQARNSLKPVSRKTGKQASDLESSRLIMVEKARKEGAKGKKVLKCRNTQICKKERKEVCKQIWRTCALRKQEAKQADCLYSWH